MTEQDWPRFSLDEVSALTGRGRRWVQDLRSGGFIQVPERSTYPADLLIRGVIAYYEFRLEEGTKKSAATKASEARTREAEIRMAKMTRDLISMSDAEDVISEFAAMVLASLTGLPARVTRDLDLRQKIEAEIDGAIDQIRGAAEKAGATLLAGGGDPGEDEDADGGGMGGGE